MICSDVNVFINSPQAKEIKEYIKQNFIENEQIEVIQLGKSISYVKDNILRVIL